MDATYLPELCMKEILITLEYHPSALLKCSLLNRHWNQYFLPELWKNPFKEDLESKIDTKKLIETFINCLTIKEKRSIIDDIDYKNPYLMYTKYLQVIDLNKLVNYITCIYPVNIHLQIYKLLCFNFLTNSKTIKKVILSKHSVFNNNTDLFLYSNSRNLSTLKEIEFNGLSLSNLIYNCRKICNELETITFYDTSEKYTDHKYYNLKNLIKSQKNLKNLSIYGFSISQNRYLYEAVKFQSHNLKCIEFDSIDFNRHCNLSYLIKCENLEELQFINCNFYGNTLSNKNNVINQDDRNDYYSDEDEDIIDVDVNFKFNNNISRLNFLKFENCNQFSFHDNQSLIIMIFGKNLKRLHIMRENDSNYLRSVNLLNDLRSINLLSIITKRCEILEELKISRCFNNNQRNNFNNFNNDDIIINDENININNSKLKYLKFEDCNQIHLLRNCSLIFSICGQNLIDLYIRGKEILEITKNINLLLILSTNCSNLKLLKISILEKYFNYIPSLFSSCQKLQIISFNNYDQRNLINIDLSKIGSNIPISLKKFTMKMNLYFTPENFKEFLINIKDKLNLEVLNFKRCELFNNDHLDMLIKYSNGNLKKLKINGSIKVDYDALSRANQFFKVENPKLENIGLNIHQIREMMPIED